jgi:hypothetical protein
MYKDLSGSIIESVMQPYQIASGDPPLDLLPVHQDAAAKRKSHKC